MNVTNCLNEWHGERIKERKKQTMEKYINIGSHFFSLQNKEWWKEEKKDISNCTLLLLFDNETSEERKNCKLSHLLSCALDELPKWAKKKNIEKISADQRKKNEKWEELSSVEWVEEGELILVFETCRCICLHDNSKGTSMWCKSKCRVGVMFWTAVGGETITAILFLIFAWWLVLNGGDFCVCIFFALVICLIEIVASANAWMQREKKKGLIYK